MNTSVFVPRRSARLAAKKLQQNQHKSFIPRRSVRLAAKSLATEMSEMFARGDPVNGFGVKRIVPRRSARLSAKKKAHALKIEEIFIAHPPLTHHYCEYDRYEANQIISNLLKKGHSITKVFIDTDGHKCISIM